MFFGRSSRCSSCGVYVVVLAPALVRSLFDKDEKLEVAAQETKQSANIAEAPAETEEKKPRRTGYKMPRCAACGHTAQQHFAIGARQCRAKDGCTCQAFIEKIRSMTTTP